MFDKNRPYGEQADEYLRSLREQPNCESEKAKTKTEKHRMMQTKVRPDVYARVKRIMKLKGLTDYQLLQMMVDCIDRYMSDRHNLTPEMERAMSIFEHLEGWNDAMNNADPSVNRVIGEAIYFLFDGEGKKKGARGVHVVKPFFGNWTEDTNIQHIIERVFCLLIPERYRRLRLLAAELGCSSQIELLDYFIDHFSKESDVQEFRRIFEDADRAENGRPQTFGQRTRRKKHMSPDDMGDNQHIITFNDNNE